LAQKEVADKDRYHVVGGQTKPKPTTYYLRLDDPLTPADAHHLAAWLQKEAPQRRAEEVTAVLKAARDCPHTELLAPRLAPFLADMPASFRYVSVLDVVRLVYGSSIAQQAAVKEEAEALHTHLTGSDYYGKEYFRVQWLNSLKPGPAFLITYLRSLCFHDEISGELRNEVTFTRPEMAENLGITTKTLVSWLDKLEGTVAKQAISSFITLLDQQRLSTNDVSYRYKIEMLEPLTVHDLTRYQKQVVLLEPVSQNAANGNNDHHEKSGSPIAGGKNDHNALMTEGNNDHHKALSTKGGEGINDYHEQELKEVLITGSEKNDHHEQELEEVLITGQGKNEPVSRKKRASYKYYKILSQSLTDKDLNSLMTAADCYVDWKFDDAQAIQPLALAVSCGEVGQLFDHMEVDPGGVVRQRMRASGLAMDEMVAWYLYAHTQSGLHKPPVHMTISRVQDGVKPPDGFVDLANLSWELWRCYACLLVAPPGVHAAFRGAPSYDLWMRHYGRFHPDALPFHVGAGVSATVASLVYKSNHDDLVQPSPCLELQTIWQPILQQLGFSMTKATFNTWLKDTTLLQTETNEKNGRQQWTIGVANRFGVDWLTHRLNKTVIEPMATAVYGQPVSIRYVVEADRTIENNLP
jgi:hypothetical protein